MKSDPQVTRSSNFPFSLLYLEAEAMSSLMLIYCEGAIGIPQEDGSTVNS